MRADAERATSVTIQHYDSYREVKHTYGKHPSLTRRCDVAVARIRLGYRSSGEITGRPAVNRPCKLCDCPMDEALSHHIVSCPVIAPFRPPGLLFPALCNYFIANLDVLEHILTLHPEFLSL